MKSKLLLVAATASALALSVGLANAQGVAPQVQSIGPNDLFLDIVGGAPIVSNQYASAALMSATFGGYGDNFIIGGDPGENLFQRSSAPTSTALTGGTGATVVYTADRWFNWEAVAGSTANATIQATTAATLGPGAIDSMLFKLTNSQTGTAQVCTGQIISNQNSAPLAGHTVELDFNAYPGATWTASQINAYIITGTDSSDGGSAKMAYGLNANSVTSTAWANQANQTVGAFPMSVSTMYRGMAVAAIPATATEVGVAFCFTPNGTSSGTGGTDGIYFSNIELRKADSLAQWANATTAYSINTTTNAVTATFNAPSSTVPAPAYNGTTQTIVVPGFTRRTPATEALLQYSYFWLIPELAANVVQSGPGMALSSTTCETAFNFPAPMVKTPTLLGTSAIGSYTALGTGTFKLNNTTAATIGVQALASTYAALTSTSTTATSANVTWTTGTTALTQYAACALVGAGGGGAFAFNAEE